ncbi:hypothetical protein MKK88_18175, partial [Methylobacterium sp. E-005]|nr:hypothetical protein [Methylobacterium sp. E-005]
MISSNEERDIYDTFASVWKRFEHHDAEMRRLMEAGQQSAALKLLTAHETATLYDDARADLSRDVALHEQGARRCAEDSRSVSTDHTIPARAGIAMRALVTLPTVSLAAADAPAGPLRAGVLSTFPLPPVMRPSRACREEPPRTENGAVQFGPSAATSVRRTANPIRSASASASPVDSSSATVSTSSSSS